MRPLAFQYFDWSQQEEATLRGSACVYHAQVLATKYDLQMFVGVETQSLKCVDYGQMGCKACSLSKAKFKINSGYIHVCIPSV